MGSEHLNWVLENVNKFILKEETKSDLPSWKTDINNDFGHDFVEYEGGILLSPLVRLTYLRNLRYSLKNNYLQCHKGIKDCSDMIVRRIENCATLMEQKALRLCMIASYYQRTMNSVISDVKNLTTNNLLHKELGKCLCSDYLSLREDKNIQAEIRPLKLNRGSQTSDHRPWTETDLDTFEAWRITNPKTKNYKSSHENPGMNEVSQSKYLSTRLNLSNHREFSVPQPVPKPNFEFRKTSHINASSQEFMHSNDFDVVKNPQKLVPNHLPGTNFIPYKLNNPSDLSKNIGDFQTHHSNDSRSNLIYIQPTESSYDPHVQSVVVKQIIDDYTSSLSENDIINKRKAEDEKYSCKKMFKSEGIQKNEELIPSQEVESKTYDSLDDRLQALFADDPSDNADQSNVPSQKNQKPWEEIMKDLLGSDDDDFPLDNNEIEELSRGLSDNELDTRSLTQSPVESEESSKGRKYFMNSSLVNSAINTEMKNEKVDEAILKAVVDPDIRIKPHFISWLSERVAQVCYFNSVLQRMSPDKRKALEKKFVLMFGPCCMFDNDDFPEEEQKKICRKRIAKIVCHHLRPFFKSKQIGSKDLFQTIARHITEQLLSKHMAADEEMTKKCVHKFFKQNGRIKSAEQLPFPVKKSRECYINDF